MTIGALIELLSMYPKNTEVRIDCEGCDLVGVKLQYGTLWLGDFKLPVKNVRTK